MQPVILHSQNVGVGLGNVQVIASWTVIEKASLCGIMWGVGLNRVYFVREDTHLKTLRFSWDWAMCCFVILLFVPHRINLCCKPLAFHHCQLDWTLKGYVWFVRVSKGPESGEFCWDCWQRKIAIPYQIGSRSYIVITFLALLFQLIHNVLLP